MKLLPFACLETLLALNSVHALAGTGPNPAAGPSLTLTDGWKQIPFTYEIQHPYDLNASDRYDFDPTNNTHRFWVYFTDKPHAPPPNKTNARTEMRLQAYHEGEYLFDG